ncbi:MAG TPA: hypothetical protein VN721_12645 [Flavipsychrobacter sp.]|nr:hypothetical protein [Flavipsychrobacter sp.]
MKKQQARDLYFQTDLTQTRIAELIDVDRKTIYLWIKEGRWAEIKRSAQYTPSILAEQYYRQLLSINEMIASRTEQPYPTSQEADIIRKLTLTIKNIKNGQTVGETVEVLMNFIHQITKTDLNLAKEILPHADKYIRDQENPPIIKPTETKEAQEEIIEEEPDNPYPNQTRHCEERSNYIIEANEKIIDNRNNLSQHDPKSHHIITSPNSHLKNDQHIFAFPHSHINTGSVWGMNGQLIITPKQAETLAQLQLWSDFVQKIEQKIFLSENEKNGSNDYFERDDL